MNKLHRAEASNAGKYNCPNCYHMNTERNLSICMKCMQGSEFKMKKQSAILQDEFGYKK